MGLSFLSHLIIINVELRLGGLLHLFSLITVMYIGDRCSLYKIYIYEEKIGPIPRYFAYDTKPESERIKKSVQKENLGQFLMQSQQVKPVSEIGTRLELGCIRLASVVSVGGWLINFDFIKT